MDCDDSSTVFNLEWPVVCEPWRAELKAKLHPVLKPPLRGRVNPIPVSPNTPLFDDPRQDNLRKVIHALTALSEQIGTPGIPVLPKPLYVKKASKPISDIKIISDIRLVPPYNSSCAPSLPAPRSSLKWNKNRGRAADVVGESASPISIEAWPPPSAPPVSTRKSPRNFSYSEALKLARQRIAL